MVNHKLAILLAMVITLGQSGSAQSEPLQIASIIGHVDPATASDMPINGVMNTLKGSVKNSANASSTPDVYTIGGLTNKLATIVQVLPQNDDTTSLFVNGTEILRLNGAVSGETSYQRVKAMAERLSHLLATNPENVGQIRASVKYAQTAKKHSHGVTQPVAMMMYGHESLMNVDAQTAHHAKSNEAELAFLYTNRLRRALGASPLKMQDLSPMANIAAGSGIEGHFKSTGHVQTGMASWYGPHFHGHRAADGSRFNQYAFTAAHRTLPFGTLVKVVNQHTQKSCLVKITDRGPYAAGRIIDLSRKAAESLGMLGSGVARVSLEIVSRTE